MLKTCRNRLGLIGVTLLAVIAVASSAVADDAKPFRVCGDPDNLPFSNQKFEGFENKIAEVLARDLGVKLDYYWWPHQRGLVRNTLTADTCDVLISIPKGYDLVLWTSPYYRSGYAVVQLSTNEHKVASLDDPALKQLKIGTYAGTPPFDALADRGLAANMVTYPLFFDPRITDPARRPTKLLEDIVSGEIDVGFAWGPLAGYFAKTLAPRTPLNLVVLPDDRVEPMTFEFSMGVRKGNQALKGQLEAAVERHRAEITKILEDYGVPLLPLKAAASPAEPTQSDKGGALPPAHKHEN